MKQLLLAISLFFLPLLSYGATPPSREAAFVFSAQVAPDQQSVLARWTIAPGYHLYRDRFNFNLLTPDLARLGDVVLPPGIPKQDDILGKYEVYTDHLNLTIPFSQLKAGALHLQVGYQGCADQGFCYPPVTKQLDLVSDGKTLTLLGASQGNIMVAQSVSKTVSQQDRITRLLVDRDWLWILLGFFGFGLLLSFTPCILPMIPILSGLIVGQGEGITFARAFGLSLAYVLAMALTYAIAGVVTGLAGNYVQAFLQSPWVIAAFSTLFVLLALSLFGLYELRLPNGWQERLTNLSNRHIGGGYISVAVMGCLSTLIVSPCVTAPLIGVLSYIGTTGDAKVGGIALFTMGIGMGAPLLLVGTLGGRFLPRAGMWMQLVKSLFGVVMLGVAILLLSRIISAHASIILWALLLVFTGFYLGFSTSHLAKGWDRFGKTISMVVLIYGFLLLVSAALNQVNLLQWLTVNRFTPVAATQQQVFKPIKSLMDLQAALATAKQQNKPVLIDFYADWCVSCKEMDHNVFTEPTVQVKLNQFILLRADVTTSTPELKALEDKFDVIAPPSFVFFDIHQNELPQYRVVGAMNVKDFLQQLDNVLAAE